MIIEHVAIYVNDLEENKRFYEKYFNGKSNDMYHNKNTGLKTYFLSFENGARLEIMTRPNLEDKEKSLLQTGLIHLAFKVGSKEKVDMLTEKLAQAGYKILSGPRTTGDGYYESCILGPENNQIEIVA
ncbi:VOC family protein [Fusobacterium mortiferum]|uniref:VOC family protein n=1 Tax=Fusobacterium mortiferum TaxID=850 RepID=UPI0022E64FA5|nr:VOC family protein [Fusobacterium mortiferum]